LDIVLVFLTYSYCLTCSRSHSEASGRCGRVTSQSCA
jgi:hypothetical protein